MSILPVGLSSAGDIPPIDNSLRFRASASAHLSKTFASAGNRKAWTWSGWVKRGILGGTNQQLLMAGTTTDYTVFGFNPTDNLNFQDVAASATTTRRITTQVFRDPSAWMHLVVAFDSDNAIANNRCRIYVNGSEITTFDTISNPTSGHVGQINNNVAHYIGKNSTAAIYYLDGYLSRICFVDGQVLTPYFFGYEDAAAEQWVSKSAAACKAVVDAGGTNSFMLDFNDGTSLTTLGNDYSSKNNDWTLNNFSLTSGPTYDWMTDTPSNNYATLAALGKSVSWAPTLTDGNLTISNTAAGATWRALVGTQALSTGKVYMEFKLIGTVDSTYAQAYLGFINKSVNIPDDASGLVTQGLFAIIRNDSASPAQKGVMLNGSQTNMSGGSDWLSGQVGMLAIDADAGKVWFGVDGVWANSGNPSTGANPMGTFTTGSTYLPGLLTIKQSTPTLTISFNYGQRPYAHSAPTGFNSLCTTSFISDVVTTSGNFTGNANANGPFVWCNGTPETLTINGNAVTFGTHADKLANGFKLRTSSSSYNTAGSNSWTATILSPSSKSSFRNQRAKGNP